MKSIKQTNQNAIKAITNNRYNLKCIKPCYRGARLEKPKEKFQI